MCRRYSFQLSAVSSQLKAEGRRLKAEKGFTLLELIITTVLVSVLLGAVWMVYKAGFSNFYTQGTRSGIKGDTGRLFINLAKELRLASSVTTAQAAAFTFTLDTDNNGVDETVQYTYSGTAGAPLNRVLTSTVPSFSLTTPVIASVNSLAFSYYDTNNNLLSFPVTPSQVRLVALNITSANTDESFQLRSNVRLRNL